MRKGPVGPGRSLLFALPALAGPSILVESKTARRPREQRGQAGALLTLLLSVV